MTEEDRVMDHDEAVRQKAPERYLLNELDPQARDQFEEHLFDCHDCALDVRAAATFIEQSKIILAKETVSVPARVPAAKPVSAGWFAWLRPALAVPALAVLLAVVGYQNFVTVPHLSAAANKPHLVVATSVNLMTYGSNSSPVSVQAGAGFLLNVIVPPGSHYPVYKLYLYNPAGQVELPLTIPASTEDTWSIEMPAAERQSGKYKVAVTGVAADGKETPVGESSFELQVQK
jgi:Putative zinc-finger